MINKTISLSSPEGARRLQTGGKSPRYKMITCDILVIIAMLVAGCGKIHTCYCREKSDFEIIDTALFESVTVITYDDSTACVRESGMDCSFWNQHDTLEEYLPEYGVLRYYVFECQEK